MKSCLSILVLLLAACLWADEGTSPAEAPPPSVATLLAAALPVKEPPFSTLTWEVETGPGMVSAQGLDPERGRTALWITLQLHEAVSAEMLKAFDATSGGYPAKRVGARWVWVLIGRVELRITAFTMVYESDRALNELVSAIDGESLQAQFPIEAEPATRIPDE